MKNDWKWPHFIWLLWSRVSPKGKSDVMHYRPLADEAWTEHSRPCYSSKSWGKSVPEHFEECCSPTWFVFVRYSVSWHRHPAQWEPVDSQRFSANLKEVISFDWMTGNSQMSRQRAALTVGNRINVLSQLHLALPGLKTIYKALIKGGTFSSSSFNMFYFEITTTYNSY